MSDATRPENTETNERLTFPEFGGAVPHSGDIGLEQPVEEFDNTTLHDAHQQGLISIPEHPGSLVTPDEQTDPEGTVPKADNASYNGLIKGIAIGAGVATLGAGVAIATLSDGETRDSSSLNFPSTAQEAEEDIQPLPPASETTVTVAAPTEFVPDSNPGIEFGVVNIAEAAPKGTDFVSATRENAQEVRVRPLGNASKPDEFGRDALGLYALYMTTGDENVLATFSANEEVKEFLRGFRQTYVVDYSEPFIFPSSVNFQITVYDKAENPAQFELVNRGGFEVVTLAAGTIRQQFSDDEAWQGLTMSGDWQGNDFEYLEFRTLPNEDGTSRIVGMKIQVAGGTPFSSTL